MFKNESIPLLEAYPLLGGSIPPTVRAQELTICDTNLRHIAEEMGYQKPVVIPYNEEHGGKNKVYLPLRSSGQVMKYVQGSIGLGMRLPVDSQEVAWCEEEGDLFLGINVGEIRRLAVEHDYRDTSMWAFLLDSGLRRGLYATAAETDLVNQIAHRWRIGHSALIGTTSK